MTHASQVIELTILNFLWQACGIAFLLKLIDALGHSLPAQVRYRIALGALLAMLASGLGSAVYESLRIGQPDEYRSAGVRYAPGMIAFATERFGWVHQSLGIPAHFVVLGIASLWSLGVLIMSVRLCGGFWFLARLRRAVCFPVPETILQKLDTIKAKLAINARVGVRIQESIQSPFVVGVLRPVIYLPLSFLSGLTSDQIELLLAHELAHVARADYLWNLIQSVTETIFFFHPAVWWIGGVLRELREHSCDDCVLDSFDYPTAYAAALLALAESRTEQRSIALSFGGEGRARHLVTRVERILRHPRNRTERLEPVALARFSIAAFVAVLLLFCAMIGVAARPSQGSAAFTTTETASQSTAKDPPDTSLRSRSALTHRQRTGVLGTAATGEKDEPRLPSVALPKSPSGLNATTRILTRREVDELDQTESAGFVGTVSIVPVVMQVSTAPNVSQVDTLPDVSVVTDVGSENSSISSPGRTDKW